MAATTQQFGREDYSQRRSGYDDRIANCLGWFSVGLGLTELLAPGKFAQCIGLEDEGHRRKLVRFYGLREIAAGIGILSKSRPAGWVWSRVAGDAVDLASLGSALTSSDANRARVAGAAAAVIGVTALDVITAQRLSHNGRTDVKGRADAKGRVEARGSIIVNRSPGEVYAFWRDFKNISKFMSHVESVKPIDDRRSHWKVKLPAGKTVEWDAEITDDQPNTRIAWHSVSGDIPNSGSVQFRQASGGRGTIIQVRAQYAPPGGAAAAIIAKLFGNEPGQLIARDLHAFKQVMETGEVVKSEASIHPGMHPARPPRAAERR
jgi:uncharacterized membrane protein